MSALEHRRAPKGLASRGTPPTTRSGRTVPTCSPTSRPPDSRPCSPSMSTSRSNRQGHLPADDRRLPAPRPSRGPRADGQADRSLSACGVPKPLVEIAKLGRTLSKRAADVLAYFDLGPAPATVQPKRSTAAWSTCAAPPSASATSPTTSPDPYSRTGGFRPRLHPALVAALPGGRPKIRRKPATSDLELNLPQVRCWGGSASAARPGTAMRKRSRRPILCHRSQWTSSRTRSDRSTAHPIAQVKHPVALNHHVRILQQVLRVDRPEVALAGPEHHGYDVQRTSSTRPAASTWPPTSPAATSTMRSPASSCALATAASAPSTK